ncbi:MAG: hypothetical protein K2Q18_09830, partial [Bdellovibrionales bacterium]|nr:hypothetical protein [Bdellovibrionales bacterium]
MKKLNAREKVRFLVADEVGLGKTIIARSVIEQICSDKNFKGLVFYVCSSLDLATQNLRKLRLHSEDRKKNNAIRLTTLPLEELELENETKIVAITPGTSLDNGRNLGKKDERFFVNSIFNHCNFSKKIAKANSEEFFRGQACSGDSFWTDELRCFEKEHEKSLDSFYKTQLFKNIKHRIQNDAVEISDEFLPLLTNASPPVVFFDLIIFISSKITTQDEEKLKLVKKLRNQLIGRFRQIISEEVLNSPNLRPALVIFDEFQNFSSILKSDNENSKMALRFIQQSQKCLFLSATPYKAPTTDWNLSEPSHYDDFLSLLEVLGANEKSNQKNESDLTAIKRLFEQRRFLLSKKESLSSSDLLFKIKENKAYLEKLLKNYLVRTERGQFTQDIEGSVDHSLVPKSWSFGDLPESSISKSLDPTVEDVEYLKCFNFLRSKGVLDPHKWYMAKEMWKSIPYPLSFMGDEYDFIKKINSKEGKKALIELFNEFPKSRKLLSTDTKTIYGSGLKNCPNPKMRHLIEDMDKEGAGEALWVIPRNTYYETNLTASKSEK